MRGSMNPRLPPQAQIAAAAAAKDAAEAAAQTAKLGKAEVQSYFARIEDETERRRAMASVLVPPPLRAGLAWNGTGCSRARVSDVRRGLRGRSFRVCR
jgi:hypothetical protein